MGLRRKARELAVQIMFGTEFTKDLNVREALSHLSTEQHEDPQIRKYALQLLEGIQTHQMAIDALIQNHSAHWKITRMSLVDLNVMRLAVYEMRLMSPVIPTGVAIDEAVEIARKFGNTDSGAFVNGILDHLSKSSS